MKLHSDIVVCLRTYNVLCVSHNQTTKKGPYSTYMYQQTRKTHSPAIKKRLPLNQVNIVLRVEEMADPQRAWIHFIREGSLVATRHARDAFFFFFTFAGSLVCCQWLFKLNRMLKANSNNCQSTIQLSQPVNDLEEILIGRLNLVSGICKHHQAACEFLLKGLLMQGYLCRHQAVSIRTIEAATTNGNKTTKIAIAAAGDC